MTGVVHCPNPACGHPSRLSLDPPGRVFRCRRCQTKLRPGAIARVPAAVLAPTGSDPGPASTFDDDLLDWLDSPSDGSSIPGLRDLPSSVPEWDVSSGMRGEGRLGRYRVLDSIGEGQYARVFRGYDPVLERAVALKVPRPGVLPAGKMQERFLGEARCWPDCGIRRSSRSSRWAATPIAASSPWGWSTGRAWPTRAPRSGRHRLPAQRGDRRRPGRRAGLRPRPGCPASRHQAGEHPHRRVGERLPDGLRPRLPARFGGSVPEPRGNDRHAGLHRAGTGGFAPTPVPTGRRPVRPGRRLLRTALWSHPVLRGPHARPLPGDERGTPVTALDRAHRTGPAGRHLPQGDGEAAGGPLPELCRALEGPEALVPSGARVRVIVRRGVVSV